MIRYVLKKVCGLIMVMFFASTLTFILIQISPGDPALLYFTSKGIVPTKEALEITREEMGLDDPLPVQYFSWLHSIVRLDLGESLSKKMPVRELITKRLVNTVKLSLSAFILLIVFSTVLGTLSAAYKNRWPDISIRSVSLVKISIPDFWLGLIFIYIFIIKLRVFKLTDTSSFKSIVLPSVTLALPLIGRYTRLIRAAMLEERNKDYVTGARARGLSEWKIWYHYILPNAMKSLITLFGLSAAGLLGGTVIIENTFAWPGIGSLAMEAISYRDYPLIQGYVLLMALMYVLFNLWADLFTHYIDPRLRSKGIGNENR